MTSLQGHTGQGCVIDLMRPNSECLATLLSYGSSEPDVNLAVRYMCYLRVPSPALLFCMSAGSERLVPMMLSVSPTGCCRAYL